MKQIGVPAKPDRGGDLYQFPASGGESRQLLVDQFQVLLVGGHVLGAAEPSGQGRQGQVGLARKGGLLKVWSKG